MGEGDFPKGTNDELFPSEVNKFSNLAFTGSDLGTMAFASGAQFKGLAPTGPGSILFTSGTTGEPYWGAAAAGGGGGFEFIAVNSGDAAVAGETIIGSILIPAGTFSSTDESLHILASITQTAAGGAPTTFKLGVLGTGITTFTSSTVHTSSGFDTAIGYFRQQTTNSEFLACAIKSVTSTAATGIARHDTNLTDWMQQEFFVTLSAAIATQPCEFVIKGYKMVAA